MSEGDGPSTLITDQDIVPRLSNILTPSSSGMLNFHNLIMNSIGVTELGNTFVEYSGAVTSTTILSSVDNTEAWARSKDVADSMLILPLIGIYLHLVSTLLTEK